MDVMLPKACIETLTKTATSSGSRMRLTVTRLTFCLSIQFVPTLFQVLTWPGCPYRMRCPRTLRRSRRFT